MMTIRRATVALVGAALMAPAALAQTAVPTVGMLAPIGPPAVPEGLNAICLQAADVLIGSATCPVLLWGGHTYWAFSHSDNRGSMTIVAYNAAGEAVRQWERAGARYVWQITVDEVARTATFWGQGTGTIVMDWDELAIQ